MKNIFKIVDGKTELYLAVKNIENIRLLTNGFIRVIMTSGNMVEISDKNLEGLINAIENQKD